jgi:hypothetical protein
LEGEANGCPVPTSSTTKAPDAGLAGDEVNSPVMAMPWSASDATSAEVNRRGRCMRHMARKRSATVDLSKAAPTDAFRPEPWLESQPAR